MGSKSVEALSIGCRFDPGMGEVVVRFLDVGCMRKLRVFAIGFEYFLIIEGIISTSVL